MRRNDDCAPARRKQPVELLHGPDHVRYVLNDMNRPQFPESAIAERERELVQIGYDIGARVPVAIDTNRTRILVNSAADIQDWKVSWDVLQTIILCGLRFAHILIGGRR